MLGAADAGVEMSTDCAGTTDTAGAGTVATGGKRERTRRAGRSRAASPGALPGIEVLNRARPWTKTEKGRRAVDLVEKVMLDWRSA